MKKVTTELDEEDEDGHDSDSDFWVLCEIWVFL